MKMNPDTLKKFLEIHAQLEAEVSHLENYTHFVINSEGVEAWCESYDHCERSSYTYSTDFSWDELIEEDEPNNKSRIQRVLEATESTNA